MATLTNILRDKLDEYRSNNAFSVEDGAAVPVNANASVFPYVLLGAVDWGTGTGYISSLDPLEVTTVTGDDYEDGDPITPSYPRYADGSIVEVVKNTERLQGAKSVEQYPLIINDTLDKASDLSGRFVKTAVRLFVVNVTDMQFTTQQRYANNYDTVINVFARALTDILDEIGIYIQENSTTHERWGDLKKYGRANSNVANVYTDALEIGGTVQFIGNSDC